MLLFNDAQQQPLWAWKDRHISDITGKTLHRSRVVMYAPMPRNPGPLTWPGPIDNSPLRVW